MHRCDLWFWIASSGFLYPCSSCLFCRVLAVFRICRAFGHFTFLPRFSSLPLHHPSLFLSSSFPSLSHNCGSFCTVAFITPCCCQFSNRSCCPFISPSRKWAMKLMTAAKKVVVLCWDWWVLQSSISACTFVCVKVTPTWCCSVDRSCTGRWPAWAWHRCNIRRFSGCTLPAYRWNESFRGTKFLLKSFQSLKCLFRRE